MLTSVPTASAIAALCTLASAAFSSEPIDQAMDQLSGTWASQDAQSALHIAEIDIEGLEHTLFVERVPADTPWAPVEHSVLQFYAYGEGVRIRKFELPRNNPAQSVYAGMGAAPQAFPEIGIGSMIPVLDMNARLSSGAISAQTPHAYPTIGGGAVEFTSELSLKDGSLAITEEGLDASGQTVWGGDGPAVFERAEPYCVAQERDDGMVIIEYPMSGEGDPVADGDRMGVHYSGFLPDGSMFDSSYFRNEPFVFEFPPGARAIPGWGIGMEGLRLNARRKLVIPGELGYGARGNPRAGIAPNQTLYFNTHLVKLLRPQPQDEPSSQSED